MNVLVESLQKRIEELEAAHASALKSAERFAALQHRVVEVEKESSILKDMVDALTDQLKASNNALRGIASCATKCPCCEMHARVARRAIADRCIPWDATGRPTVEMHHLRVDPR